MKAVVAARAAVSVSVSLIDFQRWSVLLSYKDIGNKAVQC